MTPRALGIAVPVALVLAASTAIAQQPATRQPARTRPPSAQECQVWHQEEAYWRYVEANDLDAYRAQWHEDFVGWPGATPVGKAHITDWIARLHADSTRRWSYELRPMSVRSYGDGVVATLYAVGRYFTDVTSGKKTLRGWTKIAHTWKRFGDRWLIITGMAAPIKAPPRGPEGMAPFGGCPANGGS